MKQFVQLREWKRGNPPIKTKIDDSPDKEVYEGVDAEGSIHYVVTAKGEGYWSRLVEKSKTTLNREKADRQAEETAEQTRVSRINELLVGLKNGTLTIAEVQELMRLERRM